MQHGDLRCGLASGPRQDAGEGRAGEAPDHDQTARDTAVWGEHSAVLQ